MSKAEITSSITNVATQAVRSQLTGTWSAHDGTFRASPDVIASPLHQLGLLRVNADNTLDVVNSDKNAIVAVGAEVNYRYANAGDIAGTRNAQHMRGQILNVLASVDTSGDAAGVSKRLGAAIETMHQAGMLPQTIATTPLTRAPTAAEVDGMYQPLQQFLQSEGAKNVFANPSTTKAALLKTKQTMASMQDAQIAASITAPASKSVFAPARIGASVDPPQGDYTPNRIARVAATDPDKKLLGDYLRLEINLARIQQMIAQHMPVPITPLLMRWNIDMRTAGMILATRGAQRTYYSRPLFSWTDDDVHQVTRGTLSFYAGAFVLQENRIYHARDVLIVGVEGGFDCTFAEGGRDKPKDGSIVSVLELGCRHDYRALITAYGSWSKMPLQQQLPKLKEMNEPHYQGYEFVRAWFGVDPVDSSNPSEMEAAYAGVAPVETLTMWRGGARYYDPVAGKAGEITHGAGPLASEDFYDRGMFKAWQNQTKYPVHGRINAVNS